MKAPPSNPPETHLVLEQLQPLVEGVVNLDPATVSCQYDSAARILAQPLLHLDLHIASALLLVCLLGVLCALADEIHILVTSRDGDLVLEELQQTLRDKVCQQRAVLGLVLGQRDELAAGGLEEVLEVSFAGLEDLETCLIRGIGVGTGVARQGERGA